MSDQVVEAPSTEQVTNKVSPRAAFDSFDASSLIGVKEPNSLVKSEASSSSSSSEPTPSVSAEKKEISSEPPAKLEDAKPIEQKLAQAAAKKMIKASNEAGSYEVPEDAKVEYKVNGQTVVRTMKEVLETISGVDNTDRYWQQFKKSQDNWKAYIGGIVEDTKAGKGLDALIKAISDQGHDPIEIKKMLRKQLLQEAQKYLELPEEDRKVLELADENEYYRKHLEEQKSLTAKQREEQNLLQVVEEVETRYGMPKGSWSETYDFLLNAQKAGQYPAKELTVDDVGQFHRYAKNHEMVATTLSEVAPHVASDADILNDLLDIVERGGVDKDDLIDIIQAAYPAEQPNGIAASSDAERAERNLSEKLAASAKLQSPAPKSSTGTEARVTRVRTARDLWD